MDSFNEYLLSPTLCKTLQQYLSILRITKINHWHESLKILILLASSDAASHNCLPIQKKNENTVKKGTIMLKKVGSNINILCCLVQFRDLETTHPENLG